MTSTNYLQNLLFDIAKLPKSSVTKFTDTVKQEYPAINALGHYDKNGTWESNEKLDSELLKEYKDLEYYLLTNKESKN